MSKLLVFWLVWRAIRSMAAAAMVIGAVALLANGHTGAAGGKPPLSQLRHAVPPVARQLERTIEKALKR